ncbi:hypothetical protein [Bradyrhizobium ganzhouense]|uniref:hypothetical protein n=1 Tax=Bradyrhizobium ganzhouense TaxID=1179767 RepID=UPI003CF972A8
MAEETFKVTINGPGLDFNQSIEKAEATSIMSFVMTGSALPSAGAGNGNGAGAGNAGAGAGNKAAGQHSSGLSAKQFLAQKKPTTLYERIACLGYFLHTERETSEFGAKELREINKEAAQQPISNLPQRVKDTASKYGFIAASGRSKQMTIRGDAVVEALPDREAVKAAMAEHPLGTRRKKKGVKKKK